MLKNMKPLKRETLQSQVYQKLCDLILQGELAPGESVIVANIAKALNVSPMPVREAISRLMAHGVLTVVSGRSIGVPRLGGEELDDLRRVRLEVETAAVRWAVAAADDTFIEHLSELLGTMKTAGTRGFVKEFLRANYDFHFAIYRQAGSSLLLEIISTLWLKISPQFHLLQRTGQYRVSNLYHEQLVEAIKTRNPDDAVAALRSDIESAYTVISAETESSGLQA